MAGVYVTGTLYLPDDLIATVRTRVVRTPKGDQIRGFVNEYNAAALGARRGDARIFVASATASQTVACDHSAAVANTDTLTVAGTALAAKASVSTESQFLIGSTDALYAANVVACINAHSVLSKIVWAAVTTAASGIFTIYAIVPGPIGNLVTLAEAGNGFTIGGSTLANGASDAVRELQLGYNTASHVAG
jgi:hypothetical protein